MPPIVYESAVGLEFEWTPDLDAVAARLGVLEDYYDQEEALAWAMVDIIREDFEHKFLTETDPQGRPWKPLVKPHKDQVGILRLTEEMYHATQAPESYDVSEGRVYFDESNLPFYWGFHEFGTSRIPVREFVNLSEHGKTELAVMQAFEDWVDEGIVLAESITLPTGYTYRPIGGGLFEGISQVTGELSRGIILGGVFKREKRGAKGRFERLD